MKTIAARLTSTSVQLQEMGEDAEGTYETTAKLQEKILALSGVDIMDGNKFKSTYDILDELGDKWDSLGESEKAALSELIAGKNQKNVFDALMKNHEQLDNVVQASTNSSGSAMMEYEKYLDSIKGRLGQLIGTFQSFSLHFLDSDAIKAGIRVLTELLNVLDKITEKTGGLGTTAIGGGLIAMLLSFKKNGVVDTFKGIGHFLTGLGDSSSKLKTLPEIFGKIFSGSGSAAAKTAKSASAISESLGSLGSTELAMAHVGDEFAVGMSTAATATEGAAISFGSILTSAGAALGITAAIAAAAVGIGLAIGAAIDEWRDYGDDLEDSNEKLKSHVKSYSELVDYEKEVKKNRDIINSKDSSQEQIDKAKANLEEIAKLVKEKYNLDIVVDSENIDDVLAKLKEVSFYESLQSAKESHEEILSGAKQFKDAQSRVTDKAVDYQTRSNVYNNAKLYTETWQAADKYYNSSDKTATDRQLYVDQAKKDFAAIMKMADDLENSGSGIQGVGKKSYEDLKRIKDVSDLTVDDAERLYNVLKDINNQGNLFNNSQMKKQFDKDFEQYKKYYQQTKETLAQQSETLFKAFQTGNANEIKLAEESFVEYARSIKEAGLSTMEASQQFALARNGFKNFDDAISSGKIDEVYESYVNFSKQIGATTDDLITGAALIKSGIGDASKVTSKNVNDLFKKLQELGSEGINGQSWGADSLQKSAEYAALFASNYQDVTAAILDGDKGIKSYAQNLQNIIKSNTDVFGNLGVEEQSQKITEMAQEIGLIPDTKKIKINVETGEIEIEDEAFEKRLAEIYEKGDKEYKLRVKAELDTGDIDITDITGKPYTIEFTPHGDPVSVFLDGVEHQIEEINGTEITFTVDDKSVTIDAETGQVVHVEYVEDNQPTTFWSGLVSVASWLVSEPQTEWDGTEGVDAYVENRPQTVWDGIMNITARVTSWIGNLFGGSDADGTAFASGNAFAKGNWGTKSSGIALGGEVGQEIVVRKGRFFTIGDNGAEFFKYKKDDIIFNAEQSRQLLEQGKITRGKRRGKTMADGTAFATGNAFALGLNDDYKDYDFVERVLDRIEHSISIIEESAKSAYKTMEDRQKASYDKISKLTEKASNQKQAISVYQSAAQQVTGDSRARYGGMSVYDVTDDTSEALSKAQGYWEKAEKAEEEYYKTLNEIGDAYKDLFDMIEDNFDNQIKLIEHVGETYENEIDKIEEQGYLVGAKYYALLIDNEKQKIASLNAELKSMQSHFDQAMSSGYIQSGSEAFFEMSLAIADVEEEIQKSEIALAKFNKELRKTEWERFDFVQDRIESLTDESDFLIDLMEHGDLFNKNGILNDKGMATLGLRGQNYNVYMNQADQYAQAIRELNAEIAKDPYNTDLIERREDLYELQRKSILAAEDEKDAIKQLVEDGINAELDSLSDLIDKYKETQSTAKNLYDYQKNVKEQSAEVVRLQKQLMAYSGDTSQEGKAQVQKIELSLNKAIENLEETQYEHYISEQEKLLDNLYDEYELILNERIDDVDGLLMDVIGTVNDNAVMIGETLFDVADQYGYTMTQNMQNIWDGSVTRLDGVITKYGDAFLEKWTAVNAALSIIQSSVKVLSDAKEVQIQKEAAALVAKQQVASSSSSSSKTSSSPPPTPQKSISVGGLINAGSAPIYQWAGGQGYHQYFSDDPIYTVLQESNGFVQVRWHNLSSGITGWFRKSDVKAYKQGGLVDFTGLAQLDGTPGKPEIVLDSVDSKNLLGLRDTLRVLERNGGLMQYLNNKDNNINLDGLIRKASESKSYNTGNTVGDIHINIPIDHVEDYDDFVRQLQKDKGFEKLVQSMTLDRLVGKSAYTKYNVKVGK